MNLNANETGKNESSENTYYQQKTVKPKFLGVHLQGPVQTAIQALHRQQNANVVDQNDAESAIHNTTGNSLSILYYI